MKTQDYIRKNALIYQRYKDNFDTLEGHEIKLFRYEVDKAWSYLPVRIDFVDGQPYDNIEQLSNDIKKGFMLISKDYNDSKLLPGLLNLKFRAIHDYLHYVLQAPFTASGEIKVFQLQKRLHCSSIGQRILFSEVVLQACYAEYFNKFAEYQKVIILTKI